MNFHVAFEGTPLETKLPTRATSGVLAITDELKTLDVSLNPMTDATRKASDTIAASNKAKNLLAQERHIQYILTTVANLAVGVGKFHLTVEKCSPRQHHQPVQGWNSEIIPNEVRGVQN